MATFEEILADSGLPEMVLAPLKDKWSETFNLITLNNERIAKVNAIKAQDPTKPGYEDYLDDLWAAKAPRNPKMNEVREKYATLIGEAEKLLKQLRDFAKENVEQPVSEDEARKLRGLVNESDPVIKESRAQLSAMVTMVEGFLSAQGKEVPGGLISLLPPVESLKNVRGRKASTSGGTGSNMTRIGGFEINGREIHRDGKANFRIGADSLSTEFGAGAFPQNKVTGEELEIAYFEAIGKELRSVKSTELPASTTFDFTKDIVIGENKTEKKTVKITVKKVGETETPKPEVSQPTTSDEKKTETPKQEVQNEKPAEVKSENVPAKKTQPQPAKK
jgi:hypothetical protein